MSLLPSEPDTSAAEEADPRVIGVDSEDADDVLAALTAETGRKLLSELHADPAPPAELADRVDTSLQNAQYHLNKLEEAGAIEVVDTMYSEKGREMNVYAPADRPLVIFAGDEEQSSGIRSALARLLGTFGVLVLASLAVQQTLGDGLGGLFGGAPDDGTQAPAPAAATETPAGTPTSEGGFNVAAETTADAARTATETATAAPTTTAEATAGAAFSLPPGAVFLLGGLTALLVVAAARYVR
ncbi:MAG: ArsR/SmtB family transcription factor [Halorientalis sp.]